MKMNIALLKRAGRWFGTGYMMKPNNLFRRLAGNMRGVLLWLAVLPRIFGEFSGWVGAEREEAFRVKTSGRS
jgi:hypothetical protein